MIGLGLEDQRRYFGKQSMFKLFKPIQLLYGAYGRGLRNPKTRFWIIGATLLWFLNPINAIPVVGEIDDAVVLTIFATEVAKIGMETLKDKRQTVHQPSDETEIVVEG
jgi:uncharacterized membrane protein YkvA (DUF1232 family)